ncbi:MAG: DUF885 family protein [Ignavibacteriae bacterium]|nr:DUF885 family protein [Ignavibacteriota bacterium]
MNVLTLHTQVKNVESGMLDTSSSDLRIFIERYMSDYEGIDRSYSLSMSPLRQSFLSDLYESWKKKLSDINFEALNQDGKIDYILFRNHLELEVLQMQIQANLWKETESLLPFASTIIALNDTRRKMESINPEQLAIRLTALNNQIDSAQSVLDSIVQANSKIRGTSFKQTTANRAVSQLSELKDAMKRWFNFYNGYDPMFTWWVQKPYEALDENLKQYSEFIKDKLVGVKADDKKTIIGDPIGRDALLIELAYEMIPYSPEELIEIANKEFAWCEQEMKKASRELGYSDDWKKALEYVKTLHVEPGKQPEMVRDLALEAIKFVEDNELVTVPPLVKESWRMTMLSPEQQLVSPFFLGGEVVQVAFPTNTMTHEQKQMTLRGNNIHFSRAVVHHELIPGHHLQGFMMDRYKSYRRLFTTPFWVEGGALYYEFLFWDMGFPKSPENKIGMLFWRMHRCARIIFSLSFHLEKMTPQECVELLVNRVGHERENATAEVRRSFSGGYGPLYQCAYMLGALQLRGLRSELVDSGTMTNRQFHDAVLQENAIPIELVRASLIKQSLSKDFKSVWKFYSEHQPSK